MAASETANERDGNTDTKNDLKKSNDKQVKTKEKWNMKSFIQQTPCVRDSLINGVIAGLGIGVASFMYSKRIKRSCDIAVGGFLTSSLISWSYCYYHRMVQFNNLNTIIKAMEKSNQKKSKEVNSTE